MTSELRFCDLTETIKRLSSGDFRHCLGGQPFSRDAYQNSQKIITSAIAFRQSVLSDKADAYRMLAGVLADVAGAMVAMETGEENFVRLAMIRLAESCRDRDGCELDWLNELAGIKSMEDQDEAEGGA